MNIRKAERQQFVHEATELIKSLGAVRDDTHHGGGYWRLNSFCGPIWLRVDENDARRSVFVGTVYTHFAKPEKAKVIVDCNPYSGKWNFHYTAHPHIDSSLRVDSALAHLTAQLHRIGCWPATASVAILDHEPEVLALERIPGHVVWIFTTTNNAHLLLADAAPKTNTSGRFLPVPQNEENEPDVRPE